MTPSTVAKIRSRFAPIGAARRLAPEHKALISRIREERLTYLSRNRLAVIADTCLALDRRGVEGLFVEAGCALGGSSILVARLKTIERPFEVYDVFGMIPPPTDDDGADVQDRYATIRSGRSEGLGGDTYYGYEDDLLAKVSSNFERYGVDRETARVELIEGLVQDTLRVDRPIAFAHIDVDWYEPVRHCLEQIIPNLVVGGAVILDDYFDWSGCRKATDEVVDADDPAFEMDSDAGSLRITRISAGT